MHKTLHLLFASFLPMVALAAPETYNIDPNHTYANFTIAHSGGYSYLHGAFTKLSGTVTLDRAARTGALNVSIDAASVTTNHAKRDEHVRSADYLNVEKFPSFTYRSTSMKFNGDLPAAVDGELTMFGVTRPVTLTIDNIKCGQVNKRDMCGANASGQLKRSDFGFNYAIPGTGDDIKLMIQIEARKDG
jgi:polyisoprenoid-binding protein YceI